MKNRLIEIIARTSLLVFLLLMPFWLLFTESYLQESNQFTIVEFIYKYMNNGELILLSFPLLAYGLYNIIFTPKSLFRRRKQPLLTMFGMILFIQSGTFYVIIKLDSIRAVHFDSAFTLKVSLMLFISTIFWFVSNEILFHLDQSWRDQDE